MSKLMLTSRLFLAIVMSLVWSVISFKGNPWSLVIFLSLNLFKLFFVDYKLGLNDKDCGIVRGGFGKQCQIS